MVKVYKQPCLLKQGFMRGNSLDVVGAGSALGFRHDTLAFAKHREGFLMHETISAEDLLHIRIKLCAGKIGHPPTSLFQDHKARSRIPGMQTFFPVGLGPAGGGVAGKMCRIAAGIGTTNNE